MSGADGEPPPVASGGADEGRAAFRGGEVADLARALDTITELGPGRLDDAAVDRARALRTRLDERLATGAGLTVAAVAGGTGVGKSALVNALAGADVAAEGLRRPTTDIPAAVTGGDAGGAATAVGDPRVDALLDWLGIARRASGPAVPDGLVLVDLPDHDSVVRDHHAVATRLAGRVDALVVVVDALKYARADLREALLRDLSHHAHLVLVALNRIDELAGDELATCRDDLARRLAESGLAGAAIVPTSARTGDGVGDLHRRLAELAATQRAAAARLAADTAAFAAALSRDLPPPLDVAATRETLLPAVLHALDAHRAVHEAGMAYEQRARLAMRSPIARLVRLPVELARSAVTSVLDDGRRPGDARAAAPSRLAAVLTDGLAGGDPAGAGVGRTAEVREHTVQAAMPHLAAAVDAVQSQPEPRRWWSAVAALATAGEAATLAGVVWLAAAGVVEWLRLPDLPMPVAVGEVPWPTALLLGGLAVRVVVGIGGRWARRRGRRRHAAAVDAEVRERVGDAVDTRLLGPLRDEAAAQERLHAAVALLTGPAAPRRR